MDTFTCPDYRNFTVLGNSYSDNYDYISLSMTKCVNGSGVICETNANIEAKMDTVLLNIILVNTYFDFDDYSSPVKTYMDDRYTYDLLPGYNKRNHVFLQ